MAWFYAPLEILMKYSFENFISVQFLSIWTRWIKRSFWAVEQALHKYAGVIINMNMVEITDFIRYRTNHQLPLNESTAPAVTHQILIITVWKRVPQSTGWWWIHIEHFSDGLCLLKNSIFGLWSLYIVSDTSLRIWHIRPHIWGMRKKWVLILYLVHCTFRFSNFTTCQHSALVLYLY